MTDSELEILSILQEFHSKLDDIANEVLNKSTNNHKKQKILILKNFLNQILNQIMIQIMNQIMNQKMN